MIFCKLVWNDLIKGTFQSKRILYLILIAVLQCMLVQIELNNYVYYAESSGIHGYTYQFADILFGVFGGCESFLKIKSGVFPYAWFALMICSLFLTFDYLNQDITQYGMQILIRTKQRTTWWLSKCVWNILSVVFCYGCILVITLFFCMITNTPIAFSGDLSLQHQISIANICYTAHTELSLSIYDLMLSFLCPLLLLQALSLLQMTLSIVIKPIYSFGLMMGILIFAVISDWSMSFARTGMIRYSSLFFSDGYSIKAGALLCLGLSLLSVIAGCFMFKHYDILPDKEASQ